jgi:hypothetical protein
MSRGRLIASAVVGSALLGVIPSASQAALLDANCPGVPDGGEAAPSRVAQTFTAVHTGTLVSGQMWVDKEAGSDFQLQILNANADGPIEGVLGSATVPDSSISSDPSPAPANPAAPVNGTFSPPVNVVAGHSYAIVLTRLGPEFWLLKDRFHAECPGNEFKSGAPGSGWTLSNVDFDFPFQVFVNPPNAFTIGKVKGKRIFLELPGPGGVDIAGTGKGKLVRHGHTDFASGGSVSVRARLTKRGKSRLRRNGKLKARAELTYTPTGGEPNTLTAKLKLHH